MAVKLEYVKGNGMFTAHLDHQVMCGVGPCSCVATPGAKLNYKDGRVVGHQVQPVRHPQVITLKLGATSDLLPDRVLHCPEIAAQLSKLKVHKLSDVPDATAAASAQPASNPSTPRRARR